MNKNINKVFLLIKICQTFYCAYTLLIYSSTGVLRSVNILLMLKYLMSLIENTPTTLSINK